MANTRPFDTVTPEQFDALNDNVGDTLKNELSIPLKPNKLKHITSKILGYPSTQACVAGLEESTIKSYAGHADVETTNSYFSEAIYQLEPPLNLFSAMLSTDLLFDDFNEIPDVYATDAFINYLCGQWGHPGWVIAAGWPDYYGIDLSTENKTAVAEKIFGGTEDGSALYQPQYGSELHDTQLGTIVVLIRASLAYRYLESDSRSLEAISMVVDKIHDIYKKGSPGTLVSNLAHGLAGGDDKSVIPPVKSMIQQAYKEYSTRSNGLVRSVSHISEQGNIQNTQDNQFVPMLYHMDLLNDGLFPKHDRWNPLDAYMFIKELVSLIDDE